MVRISIARCLGGLILIGEQQRTPGFDQMPVMCKNSNADLTLATVQARARVSAAGSVLRATGERNHVFSIIDAAQFHDAPRADDSRAVDSKKCGRIEPALQGTHGLRSKCERPRTCSSVYPPGTGRANEAPSRDPRRRTVKAIASELIAAARGCFRYGCCDRPAAKGIPPTIATRSWESAWQGRCRKTNV